MRKDTLYIFGSLALFAWVAMTYFLFVHRPNHNVSDLQRSRLESLQERIHTFEVRLNESLETNQAFLVKMKEAIDLKNSGLSDKAFKSVSAKSPGKEKGIDGPVRSEPVSEKATKVSEAVEPDVVIPVLMFACNRVTVNLALDSLLNARKDSKKFPIIVSQVLMGRTIS